MKTDDLIERLGRDSAVATPLPAPSVRTTAWMLWSGLYLLAIGARMMIAAAAGGVMITPLYLVQQVAAFVTGITAAWAALVSVIPGASSRWRVLPFACAGVWVASLLLEALGDVRVSGTLGVASQTDWPCVASMTMGGVLLGGPLIWMLRQGAPLTPRTTAFLGGLAALSVANIEACLTRPHAFASTVLLWHGGTIVLTAVLSAGMGRRWFRWPSARLVR